MMKMKHAGLCAVLLSAALLATACGGKSPQSAAATAPAASVTSLSASVSAPVASASPAASTAPPSAPAAVSASPAASAAPPAKPATAAPAASTAAPATPAPATPAPTAATPAPTQPPADTSAQAEALFKGNCMACHGGGLEGGFGPNLQKVGARLTKEKITNQIQNGGGGMPPFGGTLSNEQVGLLAAWLAGKK